MILHTNSTSPKFPFDNLVDVVIESIYEHGYRHIVITGGEPTIHWESDVVPLIERIYKEVTTDLDEELIITVETNGFLYKPMYSTYVDLISISPKLQKMSGFYEAVLRQYVNEPLMYFESRDMQFKFLVDSDESIMRIKELLERIEFDKISEHAILIFQPIWSPTKDYTMWTADVVDLVQKQLPQFAKYNVRVIPQLHKFLWGNERYK